MSQIVNQLTGFLLICQVKKSNILQDVCVEGAVSSQLRVTVCLEKVLKNKFHGSRTYR